MTTSSSGYDSETPVSPADSAKPNLSRVWWHRHLEPEERRRVLNDLAIKRGEGWTFRFTVMLTLSVIVAVMGLSLNSAAVVIGAMLLAPLMQPVLATGACLSMALYRKSAGAFIRVVIATVWCIGISYVLSKINPDQDLTPEVLARTGPDIKDLVVALAAGTAGAYATVREDASASLPGVAVAVALVPPLGSVGIMLAAGDTTLAWGALLLYTTNLAAIIFASISVFVVTGFVPPRRIKSTIKGVSIAKLGLAGLVALIAYPLYQASVDSVKASEDQLQAKAVVDSWLNGAELESSVDINGDKIVVALQGFERPPSQDLLEQKLGVEFPSSEVRITWVRTERITTPTTSPADPTRQLENDLEPLVVEWLDSTIEDYEIEEITIEGDTLRIDAVGAGAPPSLDELDSSLGDAGQDGLTPRLNWTQRETIRPGDDEPSPIDQIADRMLRRTEDWAVTQELQVREFAYDGVAVEIEIAGDRAPAQSQLALLVDELVDAHGDDDVKTEIYFLERQTLSQ